VEKVHTKEAAEALLRELPSVLGAFVREDINGHPREIHLLVGPGPSVKLLAQDVRDLLEERLEVPIDHRIISIAQLAAVVSLSQAHFIRSFARTLGMPPHQYVRARRMQRAREELSRGASVAAAAHAVGFASVTQFRSAFRQTFGHVPRLTPQRGAREWTSKGTK
jgi:AraC-like DNA-binding protein